MVKKEYHKSSYNKLMNIIHKSVNELYLCQSVVVPMNKTVIISRSGCIRIHIFYKFIYYSN